jgi:two-component system, response regulator PdtaR
LEKRLILVVEDEAIIRLSAVHMLEDAGFAVVDACNADAAIQILESRSDIRAVVTDVKMPGSLDGLRLAHVIAERWPTIRVVVASGQRVPTEAEFPINGRFIRKPYDAKTLLTALDELFGQNPSPYKYVTAGALKYGMMPPR